MTYAQLIRDAYEDIGWKSKGKSLDGEDLATALRTVQRILGLWSDSPLMTPTMIYRNFALTTGQNSYTIGESGTPDVSNPRPTEIRSAFIRDSGSLDYPLDIITVSEFVPIAQKDLNQRPEKLFYLPSLPNGTIYFDSDAYTASDYLHYYADEPLSEPSKTSESIALSPSYRQGLFCRLKISLATKKHMPIDPLWMSEWKEAKAAITTNATKNRTTVSQSDIGSSYGGRHPDGRRYNILGDW